jgi:hypothetical protein
MGNVYATGNVETAGFLGDGTLANLSANIVTLESNLGLYESNIHLEGYKVGISPSDFTPLANLHVMGNVYATGNVETAGFLGDGTLANLSANIVTLESDLGLYESNVYQWKCWYCQLGTSAHTEYWQQRLL